MRLNWMPAGVIAAWPGHTDARFALATYARSSDDALAAAAATFGDVVGAQPEAVDDDTSDTR